MTRLPKFSLLLPVYHADDPGFLFAAFESAVVKQHLRPDQVVIVQDGPVGDELASTLARLVSESPVRVTMVEQERNEGLAVALTHGLAASDYDVVARMDADDLSEPERFAEQLPMIASGLDLVGSALNEFTVDDAGVERTVGRRVPPLTESAIRGTLPFRDPFNHPTVVYRRSVVDRVGGYLEMGMMEDYWLFARMVSDGARIGNSASPLVRYRISSGAYARRGGLRLLSSEILLQRAFREARITTRRQFARNVVVRGGYRLIPEFIRRPAYRSAFVSSRSGDVSA